MIHRRAFSKSSKPGVTTIATRITTPFCFVCHSQSLLPHDLACLLDNFQRLYHRIRPRPIVHVPFSQSILMHCLLALLFRVSFLLQLAVCLVILFGGIAKGHPNAATVQETRYVCRLSGTAPVGLRRSLPASSSVSDSGCRDTLGFHVRHHLVSSVNRLDLDCGSSFLLSKRA